MNKQSNEVEVQVCKPDKCASSYHFEITIIYTYPPT